MRIHAALIICLTVFLLMCVGRASAESFSDSIPAMTGTTGEGGGYNNSSVITESFQPVNPGAVNIGEDETATFTPAIPSQVNPDQSLTYQSVLGGEEGSYLTVPSELETVVGGSSGVSQYKVSYPAGQAEIDMQYFPDGSGGNPVKYQVAVQTGGTSIQIKSMVSPIGVGLGAEYGDVRCYTQDLAAPVVTIDRNVYGGVSVQVLNSDKEKIMQAQLPANDYQPSNIFFDNRQQVQITFSPTNPADSSYLLMINNFGMATLFKNNDIYAQPPALYPGDYFDLQFGKYADTDEKFLQIMELNSYGDKVL